VGKLYKRLCKAETIWRAWSVVLENGRTSRSARTRAEVSEFAADAPKRIQNIAWKLPRGQYQFAPAHGIAILKKNKKDKRPVVMAPIPNRIVQRAILDIVQTIPAIKQKLSSGRNFGGIAEAGVPKAIREAYIASRRNGLFIRTDIKSFFDKIPREKAISKVTRETGDVAFNEIVKMATTTELDNLVALGRDGELFPLEEIGVAQGSALSPLLCNLLLEEFDEQMNERQIVCIRYIDDFILFAPNRAKALAAFSGAQQHLQGLSKELDCYSPSTSPTKAEEGATTGIFQFLGCEIQPNLIRPSRDARSRLMERLQTVMADALSASGTPRSAIRDRKSYVDSMHTMSNIIRGWGNTYSFCTDDRLMRDIDKNIDDILRPFRGQYFNLVSRRNSQDQRRLLGVSLIEDCIRDESMRQLVKDLSPQKPQ
jgi:hypothetical protein